MPRFLLLLVFAFLVLKGNAAHIIGGDIYYDYLGNNQYRFYITLYRDCASSGAAYDDPLQLAIHLGNGNLYQNVSIPFPGSTPVPLDFNNPCATPPGGICVEKATYITVVTLAPTPLGYDISYQRCCRGPNVTNLITPDDTGITLTTHIPGSNVGNGTYYQNSSPRFVNYPPILLCNTEAKIFNHGATDPDGDVLSYSLVTPNAGASSITPLPPQTPPPPFPPVVWAPGYNANTPLGAGSTITINPTTGVMQVIPQNIGLFVVGVKVTETRNGVVIGSTVRDFLFRIFNCNITLQALLPTQEQLPTFVSYCQGLTVNFVNNSYGGSSYAWDFGVAGTNSDVSTSFQPSFTYPAPGTYTASLIVNPGQACTDTAFMTVIVNNPFSVSWTSADSLCVVGNAFNFTGISSSPPGIGTYSWAFSNAANVNTANGLTANNISFNAPGFHEVTLNGNNGDCTTSFTDSVYLFDVPLASASVPPNLNCLGLTVSFGNSSTNAAFTHWDFGVQGTNNDTSNVFTPTYTYSSAGTYLVVLNVSSGINCNDADTLTVTINEPLILAFTNNDSLCINGGAYNFDATVSGPPNATYWWDFGPHGNPSTANSIDVLGVAFLNPGIQPITLYGSFDNCMDSLQSQVYVYAQPEIGFSMIPGLQCAPHPAVFINTSVTDGPTHYLWDFGDGTTANSYNGFHTYYQVGNYSVGLTVITLLGCVDTLYLLQQDIINVNPSPTAMFSVSPQEVNICDNQVTFTNESSGATSYWYLYDQNGFVSQEPNFTHEYVNVGNDYPQLIVANQYGCTDSIRQTLTVLPFSIYIPNTFIPDKDGKNDAFLPVCSYEIYEWDFHIYNRWGQTVYFTDHLEQGWDGTYRGIDSPDGVYAYTLRYRGCEHPSAWQFITGSVRLLR